jgi:serine/threonine protein kinase
MPSPSGFADHNLLFAVLAWREGLVSGKDVLDALHAWSESPDDTLSELLRRRGKLTLEEQALIQTRLELHLSSRPAPPTILPTAAAVPKPSRYLPDHLYRAGGLGEVWAARDTELDRRVALKQIHARYADHHTVRERFVREARVTGWLEHPGVVPVYGLGIHADGRPYYTMRFVEGQTLTEVIRAFHRTDWGGKADPSERAMAFRDLLGRFVSVCQTVAYAHSRGVLHRDLKPDNVLVGPYGETLVVDWGLAKVRDDEEPRHSLPVGLHGSDAKQTEPGSEIGTPAYMAPEQRAGKLREIDEQTDVYLLGGILYEILTDRPPHALRKPDDQVEPARTVKPDAPAHLEAVAARALDRVRASRHGSAGELATEIRRWLADEPLVIYRELVENGQRRVAELPDETDLRAGLARNRTSLALVLIGLQRYPEAESSLCAAIADYESLTANRRQFAGHLSELAITRVHLSNLLAAVSRLEEAEQQKLQALREYEQLIATNPEGFRVNLASMMFTWAPGGSSPTRRPEEPPPQPPTAPDPEATAASPSTLPPEPEPQAEETGAWGAIEDGYVLNQLLWSGASSEVFVGRDKALLREVVIKAAKQGAAKGAGRLFLREARIMAQLEHPGIPPIYAIRRQTDGTPFIVRQWVRGTSLQQHAETQPGAAYLLLAFVQTCRTLSYAHRRGVIHGDPKPANVLLGETGHAAVIDWEYARLVEAEAGHRSIELGEPELPLSAIAGTPSYMAPELFFGGSVSRATDVYALGATLYHVLVGDAPNLERKDLLGDRDRLLEALNQPSLFPRQASTQVPETLDAICARATMRNPAERYATADDLADAVQHWLDQFPAWSPVPHRREAGADASTT